MAAKAKKAKKVKIQKPPVDGDVYQLDMEKAVKENGRIIGWDWYAAQKQGDLALCESTAKEWKRDGCGGRLLRLDGTPDGELIEQWSSIGRLEWSAAQESVNKS